MTEEGSALPLSEAPVKLVQRPEGWPTWLPATLIHADIASEIALWQEQQKVAPSRGSFEDCARTWRELTAEHLASEPEEFLGWVLAPTIVDWSDQDWERLGWEAIDLCATWGATLLPEAMPWVPPAAGMNSCCPGLVLTAEKA